MCSESPSCTFNEKEHKKLYTKWLGMMEKVRKHVDPKEIGVMVCTIEIRGLSLQDEESPEDKLEIPDVPLQLE